MCEFERIGGMLVVLEGEKEADALGRRIVFTRRFIRMWYKRKQDKEGE